MQVPYALNGDDVRINLFGAPYNPVYFDTREFRYEAVNIPVNTEVMLYGYFSKKFLKTEALRSKEVIPYKEIVKTVLSRIDLLQYNRKKSSFDAVIARNYLLRAFIAVYILQVIYYILNILRGLIGKKFIYDDIDAENVPDMQMNLVRTFVLENKDVYLDKYDTLHLVEATLVKLEELEYFKIIDGKMYINRHKTFIDFNKLTNFDKSILDKIYSSDYDNDFIFYDDEFLTKTRLSSREIIQELDKESLKELLKLKRERIQLTTTNKIDPSLIYMILPIIALYASVGYIPILSSIILIFTLYLLYKWSLYTNDNIYTKKGLEVVNNIYRYKNYLSKLYDIDEEIDIRIPTTDRIFSIFYGLDYSKKNVHPLIKEFAQSICSTLYLNILDRFKNTKNNLLE